LPARSAAGASARRVPLHPKPQLPRCYGVSEGGPGSAISAWKLPHFDIQRGCQLSPAVRLC